MSGTHHNTITDSYRRYKSLDESIDTLYGEERFEEAATMLGEHMGAHPEYAFELNTYLIQCLNQLGDDDAVMELLRAGHGHKWAFPLHWGPWKRFEEKPEWSSIMATNKANLDAIAATSEPGLRVNLPEGRSGTRPLFIVLHGDGATCNIKIFQNEWRPEILLDRGYIVAYFQSSHPVCTNGYGWTNDYPRSRDEIRGLFDRVVEEHSVDIDRVCIGGFSGGAMASLNLMAHDTIPICGVAALCPDTTDDVDAESVSTAAARGVRLALFEGELSGEVRWHHDLLGWAEAAGMQTRYAIIPGVGHAVPPSWSRVLTEAMDFLEG